MAALARNALAPALFLVLAGLPACHGDPSPAVCSAPQGSAGAADALAAADTTFAISFFPPAGQAAGVGKNVIVSPYGVSSVLSMLDVGAAGDTAAQIEHTLSLPGSGAAIAPAHAALACADESHGSADGNTLAIVNSVWGQQGMSFRPAFLSTLSSGYQAPLQQADFASDAGGATSAINQWVSARTQGAIPTLIEPRDLDGDTRLVLVNAIHFKGAWANAFDPARTAPQPFTLEDGTQVQVPTMEGVVTVSAGTGDGFVVVEIPYEGGAMSMDILLPEGKLSALEQSLTSAALSAALGSMHTGDATLSLPRFSVHTRLLLHPVLQDLGIIDVFDPSKADLSGIDGERDLVLEEVVQAAMIEVDEQGTVAAAATAGVVEVRSAPTPIMVDHPFLFLLRDTRTGSVLFMGHVEDPRGQASG